MTEEQAAEEARRWCDSYFDRSGTDIAPVYEDDLALLIKTLTDAAQRAAFERAADIVKTYIDDVHGSWAEDLYHPLEVELRKLSKE